MTSSPSSILATDCSDDSMKNEPSCDRQLDPVTAVGQDRLSHSAARRMRYLASLIYWTLLHRSLSRGRLVAEFEGHSWN